MKEGSILDLMSYDILDSEELKTKERFYRERNYGGAESWFLKKALPVWREKVSLAPEYAGR